jgi:hypothetical protein
MKYFKLLFIATLLILINSCKEEDKTPIESDTDTENPREYTPEIIQEEYGSARVVGFVKGKDGSPLDGVRVYFGEHESITDGEGKFQLTEVSEGSKKRIWFEKDGFVKTQKLIDVREDLPNRVDAALFLIGKTQKMTDAGGLIEGEDFSVEIQPGGFVYSDGEVVIGEVTVSATPFLTSEDNFIEAFPGDFEGRREDGSISAIESFGFIDVDLRDSNGEPVQLADGVIATIKIKAPQNAPESIPMWYYDLTKAEWIEEGIGTPDNGFYTAEVSHFTPWNWDLPIERPISSIIGRVVDNLGGPIEGARVIQKGLNRTYFESTKSLEDGTFEMITLEGLELDLEAQYDIYGSTIIEKITSSNLGDVDNFGDILINVEIENILPPSINYDTVYVTMNQLAIISGKYFGDEKEENYKLLLNGSEMETISWENDSIIFMVPNGISNTGTIQLDRGGYLSKVIPYKEGDWFCEIGGIIYNPNYLEILIENTDLVNLPSCIENIKNLEILDISDNQIDYLPETIGNLRNLRQFDLGDNQILELPQSLGNLSKLEILKIHDNGLISLPNMFENLKELKVLWMGQNNFPILPESLNNLKNLESIGLSYSNLNELPEFILNNLSLKSLYLNGNKIEFLPESIKNLSDNLNYLDLQYNPIPNSERVKIQSWLPNTTIQW